MKWARLWLWSDVYISPTLRGQKQEYSKFDRNWAGDFGGKKFHTKLD